MTFLKPLNFMKKHILLIENDDDILEFFSAALQETNLEYICSRATSIHQAFVMLRNLTPDIIFLNMNLRNLSGAEFVQKIKTMDCLKQTPVVLYSTMILSRRFKEALAGSEYILLPGNVITMASILKNLLKSVKEVNACEIN